MATALAFNLLCNALLSFATGWLIVAIGLRLLRCERSFAPALLLWLPFAKVLWDLAFGVSKSWYAFAQLDPFHLPPKSKWLHVGAGWCALGPTVNVQFSLHDAAKQLYAISGADFLHEALTQYGHPCLPRVVLATWASIAGLLVLRRAISLGRFEGFLHGVRRHAHRQHISMGQQTVAVYLCDALSGTPFVGGLLSPTIYFPRATWRTLEPAQRHAIVAHEMAHLRSHDLFWRHVGHVFADLLWFVPGARRLQQQIQAERELVADRRAVANGVDAGALATALLAVHSLPTQRLLTSAVCAATPHPSLTERRIRCMFAAADRAQSKPGRLQRARRLGVCALIAGTVLSSSLAGNQAVQEHWPDVLVPWILAHLH